jgi:hypothetical protein
MPFINSVRGSFGPQGKIRNRSGRVSSATSGGTITTPGDGYRYHAFTNVGSSTFVLVNPDDATIDVLVVGGGGASSIQHSGGAGAGGLVMIPDYPFLSGSYNITVGAGGVVTSNLNSDDSYRIIGQSGSNSTFGSVTALGGGGAQPWAAGDVKPGGNGGSGGAGYNAIGQFGQGLQPSQPGLSGQYGYGNRSGNGQYGSSGGGAGAAGSDSQNSTGGAGKYISQFSQFGVAGYFAGGGGGGYGFGGAGGIGGGGGGVPNGQSFPPSAGNGVPNTGGGGGGCGDNTTGGNGGSGVVLIRYRF